MHLRDVYYLVKPVIPRRIRTAVRQAFAIRLRRRFDHCWPIDEASGHIPEDWPGWPGGKTFAFVLTHDVEGTRGLDRCRQLAQIEINLGFRSSFNFVPEGEYVTPPSLRSYLNEAGFEVGVHDLHHDGKLYRSREAFEQRAERINHYLKAWGAAGFRSAFMLHNLDWLGRLQVQYDASTFDTDPFEPQPDGMTTIFPFRVPRDGGAGYVELPYTLAQDSTLFLVLGESTIDVWKKKVDWISSRGGMALVNVHPDYVSFDRSTPARGHYSVGLYEQFLTYVRGRYGRDAWFALPHEIAAYVNDCHAAPSLAAVCAP